MGGIKKVLSKVGIGGGAQAAIEYSKKGTQATQQQVFEEDSADRTAKDTLRKGKKKLQIPTTQNTTTTTTSGTGLGTGV